MRVEAHQTENGMLHLVLISTKIDHLNNFRALRCDLSLYLFTFIVVTVINILTASHLLKILIVPDYLMLGLGRLSAYFLALLMINFVTQDALPIVLDSWRCREQLG